MRKPVWTLSLLLGLGGALACSDSGTTVPDGPEALVKRGQQVYQNNCTACHSRDPGQDGAVGPIVAGASLELLQAKVLRGEYPPGYTPKRDTGAMPLRPDLEADLPALAAYLETATGS